MLVDPLAAMDGTPLGPDRPGDFERHPPRRRPISTSTGRCAWSISAAAARSGSKRPMQSPRPAHGLRRAAAMASPIIGRPGECGSTAISRCRAAACRPRALPCRQPRSGAPMSGVATSRPIGSETPGWPGADPLRRRARTVRPSSASVALLDGPLPGGRVRGLKLPIDGRFGGRRRLRIRPALPRGELRELPDGQRFAFGRRACRSAPIGPAIAYQGSGRRLAARRATCNRPRSPDSIGQSPFSAAAPRPGCRPNGSHWPILAVRLGARGLAGVDRRGSPGGQFSVGHRGTFSGGSATLGRVPLLLSEASGDWRMRDGRVSISGGMLIVASGRSAEFLSAAQQRHAVHAGRRPDPRHRHRCTIRRAGPRSPTSPSHHDLDSGSGNAVLDVPGITFGPGLQPEELTRLTEGVIALVQGPAERPGADRLDRVRRGHFDRRVHDPRHGPRRQLRSDHRHERDDPFHRPARPARPRPGQS